MFYKKSGIITIKDIAELIEIKNLNELDLNFKISELSEINTSSGESLTFFNYNAISGSKFLEILKNRKPGFCLVSEKDKTMLPESTRAIVVDSPYLEFLNIYDHFYKPEKRETFIDSTAVISKSAIIKNGARIGARTIIKDGVIIGEDATIGEDCVIDENAVINFATIGSFSHIRTGAKIGQDGFGFLSEKFHGIIKPYRIKHFGLVIIGNEVSIGANTCVDRGTFDNTEIGHYTKIDNLVQIAHNVKIGSGTMIAGCVAIAGNAIIGNRVLVGGRSCIAGHIKIGDGSIIYGQTPVSKSFPANSKILSGWPGENYSEWVKKIIFFNTIFEKSIKIFARIRVFKKNIIKVSRKIKTTLIYFKSPSPFKT